MLTSLVNTYCLPFLQTFTLPLPSKIVNVVSGAMRLLLEEPRKSAGWNCEKEFYSSGRVTVKALAEEYFEDASGEIEDRQMNFSCQGRLSLNKLIHHP